MAVAPGADLTPAALRDALPDRPVRTYPALLSTDADAQAWARAGAPAGALVVADYQASPRGRGGVPWTVQPGRGLGFSLVVRPDLPADAQGWPYIAATTGLAALVGEGAATAWPDLVCAADGRRAAAVGVFSDLEGERVRWAVLTVLVEEAAPPRALLLAAAVAAIEAQLERPAESVLDDYRKRCATLGRRVRARLVPLGPEGPAVEGLAGDVRPNGGLVIVTDEGRRAVVPPPELGVLDLC